MDGTLTYSLLEHDGDRPSAIPGRRSSFPRLPRPVAASLAAATNAMNNIEAPTTGLLKSTESALQSQITDIGTTIAAKQAQVNLLQTNLEPNQMAKADAIRSPPWSSNTPS